MHNTGRALATQWDGLLGYYCQSWGWHRKTADAVGGRPAGYLVSSQMKGWRFYLGREQVLFVLRRPLPFHNPIADPSRFDTWGQRMVRCSQQAKKKKSNLKQTENPQVGPVSPKVRANQGKQFVFPSKPASCSNTRGQQKPLSDSKNCSFMAGEWWHGG